MSGYRADDELDEDHRGRPGPSWGPGEERLHVVPPRAQTFGMLVFLLTLTILFAAGMIAYVFIRLTGAQMPEPGALRDALARPLLFVSTAIVLSASVTIHLALVNVRRERQGPFIRWLLITDALALAFLAVQTPAMYGLLSSDVGAGHALTQAGMGIRETRLYGLIFFFVLVHAAHVLGGMIYLAIVTHRALDGLYDHEHYVGVRHAAMYWHFLDLVWLGMFGTFLFIG